jgi:hypothetical protein
VLAVTAITDLRNVKTGTVALRTNAPIKIPSRQRGKRPQKDWSPFAHLHPEKNTEGTMSVNGGETTARLEKHTCV